MWSFSGWVLHGLCIYISVCRHNGLIPHWHASFPHIEYPMCMIWASSVRRVCWGVITSCIYHNTLVSIQYLHSQLNHKSTLTSNYMYFQHVCQVDIDIGISVHLSQGHSLSKWNIIYREELILQHLKLYLDLEHKVWCHVRLSVNKTLARFLWQQFIFQRFNSTLLKYMSKQAQREAFNQSLMTKST